MFPIGKIIPERINVGIISPIPEISTAVTCVCTRVEISNPSESDRKMKRTDTATNSARFR